MLLAGDIGGTKTVLAVFATESGLSAPLAEASFPSAHYSSLEAVALEFLTMTGLPVERAAFGVAGPVVAGRAEITNLPWVIEEDHLRATLGVEAVTLLNDLTAIGSAIPHLGPADLFTLNVGVPEPGGTIAVIAPGTGLGEGYLTYDCGRYRAHESEGGHADFAPNTSDEIDLLRYLFDRLDHVSYERICSGLGIPNIYAYLRHSRRAPEPSWLAEALAAASDPTPVIVGNALDPASSCELCRLTLEMFVSILGSEAGNLALKVLATGGVYLGGGIPPRILPALQGENFLSAFRNKGRLSDVLVDVPVHVILNRKAALLGAAYRGMERD